VTLRDAPAGTGVLFRRTDIVGRDPLIPARWDRVEITPSTRES
jgi:UDP-3-O-[3-hydroxymyristoyl] N-acetylglucosamine deacetylase